MFVESWLFHLECNINLDARTLKFSSHSIISLLSPFPRPFQPLSPNPCWLSLTISSPSPPTQSTSWPSSATTTHTSLWPSTLRCRPTQWWGRLTTISWGAPVSSKWGLSPPSTPHREWYTPSWAAATSHHTTESRRFWLSWLRRHAAPSAFCEQFGSMGLYTSVCTCKP